MQLVHFNKYKNRKEELVIHKEKEKNELGNINTTKNSKNQVQENIIF